jgi:hypothetical protein
MMTATERLNLFVQILDREDYGFLRSLDARRERQFRRDRIRIFRRELRAIANQSRDLFRVRRSNLSAAGRWGGYWPLAMETAGTYLAIGKLWTAGMLLAWRMPEWVNASRNANLLRRYVTSQKFF